LPQSPELAGGAGFTFEDRVSATYLAALLHQGFAPGLSNRTVCRVALQQRDFGEPLDDVSVDFQTDQGDRARLSLQVKRSLTISSAPSNTDFQAVVLGCWRTFKKPGFRKGTDRYGSAIGDVAIDKARDLRTLCDLARASATLTDFEMRFTPEGNASAAIRYIKNDIAALVEQAVGAACSDQDLKDFLAHFVLIQFDFLHEGQADPPTTLNALRACLKFGEAAQTSALWDRLCTLAREGAGRSEVFERPRLVHSLSATFQLVAAPTFQHDFERLKIMAQQWLADINDDVGGIRIERPALSEELESKLASNRWVQIRGLPGSGKSVQLRHRVEADLACGPVLFLKSDRLEGTGWASFATANGISNINLPELLVELAATGSSTLYIDGIDRIEKQHRSTILDIIHPIMMNPLLNNWRVVVSLRDTGIEPLRNWLGSILDSTGIGTVEVKAFNDEEANRLSEKNPHLRSLLFGSKQVREIVRRPFFAKILTQNFESSAGEGAFQPRSEVDLISYWWERGGYDEEKGNALKRQRAIIELAVQRARHLDRDIAIRELSQSALDVIDQLEADGIIQHVRRGHSFRFSHDIFFEWAFFQVLLDVDDWLEEIRACGEPPAVARVVELLSQKEFGKIDKWVRTLNRVNNCRMRPQWTRAWLLAPIAASNFKMEEASFVSTLAANDYHFFKKILVWFQAEKTVPHPGVLAGNFPPEERIRYADLMGCPSDLHTWSRFIYFLLGHRSSIPVTLLPDVITIFQVWQNALQDIKNPVSDALLEQSAAWLNELTLQATPRYLSGPPSRWESLGTVFDEFRNSLSNLILRSAAGRPDLTRNYLTQIIHSNDLRCKKFEEVMAFSPTLARTHPDLLMELAYTFFRQKLPEEVREQDQRKHAESVEQRKRIQAMPPEERTRLDELTLLHPSLGMNSLGHFDWERLAVNDHLSYFFPPSPLREPFQSLFASAPDLALHLLVKLSNHAITAWLQLHELAYDSPGTPVPLDVEFPWGRQRFWGGDREYLWSRGTRAPKPLACGYLALEEWALGELDRGRPAEELIHQIVSDNQCIAVMGVAVVVALQAKELSDTIFPIVTSQRLLAADHRRWEHDAIDARAALIGFEGKKDLLHIEAIKKMNIRPIRKIELRWLLSLYFLNSEFRERTKAAVLNFTRTLPFRLEHERFLPEAQEHLFQQATEYAELVNGEYYQRVSLPEGDDRIAVVHVSPTKNSPERLAQAEQAKEFLRVSGLFMWGHHYFETGLIDESFTIQSALDLAKSIDSEGLFETPCGTAIETEMQRSAVAAIAAISLDRREGISEVDLTWCRQVLKRAEVVPEGHDIHRDLRSANPWHQVVFVAKGICADIRHGTADPSVINKLLCLVANPVEVVSLAALEGALSIWDKDPRLGWCALYLALSLCITSHSGRSIEGLGDEAASQERILAVIKETTILYGTLHEWPNLPFPPDPWIRVDDKKPGGSPQEERSHHVDHLTGDDVKEQWAPSPTRWDDHLAAQVIARIPLEKILRSPAAPKLLEFLTGLLPWTYSWLMPPWKKRWGENASHGFDWTHSVGEVLGKAAGLCSLSEATVKFLEPICALEDDACFEFLSRFVGVYNATYIYDAKEMHQDSEALLMIILVRFLNAKSFDYKSYRSGKLNSFDLQIMAKDLMFVPLEMNVGGAVRYANGDWKDIDRILPVVDHFVRSAGWAASVMYLFLELCERAKIFYPAKQFADQVLHVLCSSNTPLKAWNGTFLTARIAGLIQYFADRETPMPLELAQRFLRILDLLVDMGDRRSSALQLSEAFREVQVHNSL